MFRGRKIGSDKNAYNAQDSRLLAQDAAQGLRGYHSHPDTLSLHSIRHSLAHWLLTIKCRIPDDIYYFHDSFDSHEYLVDVSADLADQDTQ